ncbi:class I adenylate-forming enzyme family protein [Streptomyces sp. NPDC086787]|uniref:class I adenylate-forming enzyme family protein n=1 Tax=Streptomyces sp. NPDC086787 TaxID=3365759 RepID=UPI003822F954
MRILRHLDIPLDGLLRRAATRFGDRPAVTTGPDTVTFGALDERADTVAHRVHHALARTDTATAVALACTLDSAFCALYFGVLRSGRPLALLDPAAGSAAARELCAATGVQIAFVPGALARRLLAQEHGPHGQPPGPHTVVVTDNDAGPAPRTATAPATGPGPGPGPGSGAVEVISLAAFLSGTTPDHPGTGTGPVGDIDAVACVQLVPHPATGLRQLRLTHRNLLANAAQIAVAHQLDAASTVVHQMPAYHPALLAAAVHAGAEQVLVNDTDPCAGMTVSRSRGATHFYGLSTRLARLAEDERYTNHGALRPDRHLRAVLCGGAALEPSAARRLGDTLRVPVLQGYGVGGPGSLGALSHVQTPGARPERGAVGAPLPGTECRVVDPGTRAPLPVWSGGEVELRGPQVPPGPAGGWLATGDVGYLDLDNQLHLVRRPGTPFACGDAVVAPGVVERALRQDPRVADCTVRQAPDAPHGPAVWAGVVLREAAQPDKDLPGILQDITARANAQLGPGEQIARLEALGTPAPTAAGTGPPPGLVRQYLAAA